MYLKMSGKVKLKKVEFLVSETLLKEYDDKYPNSGFNDRSDALRDAMRKQIDQWNGGK